MAVSNKLLESRGQTPQQTNKIENKHFIMKEKIFQSQQIDDDTYYDPAFSKYGSYEMESQYYPLIGELVSVFNSLEYTLSEELIEYIENDKMPNAAYIIISGMSFSTKWRLWVDLLLNNLSEDIGELKTKETQELKEHKSKISSIGKTFERFGKIRNDLVHGTWGYINEQGLIKTKTKTNNKKQLVHEHIEIKRDDFNTLISEIEKFDIEFLEYSKKIREEIE